jgi:hypothetical protein
VTDRRVDDTRGWVRDVVRAGLWPDARVRAEVVAVVAEDHPDLPAEQVADAWIADARAGWSADAATWPDPTDFDLLQTAFATLEQAGFVVLQGCADHWAAKETLERQPARGALWFTPPDVWHAIDEAMLEVNLWHPDTANAAPGDALLDEVLAALGDEGLAAHFDEGRIEVTARWQRRPGTVEPPPGIQ